MSHGEGPRSRPAKSRAAPRCCSACACAMRCSAAALMVLLLLGGVILSLIIGSLPALHTFGLDFFTTEIWNPVTEKFGALAPVYGTLVTSAIAMLIAVPVGLL